MSCTATAQLYWREAASATRVPPLIWTPPPPKGKVNGGPLSWPLSSWTLIVTVSTLARPATRSLAFSTAGESLKNKNDKPSESQIFRHQDRQTKMAEIANPRRILAVSLADSADFLSKVIEGMSCLFLLSYSHNFVAFILVFHAHASVL